MAHSFASTSGASFGGGSEVLELIVFAPQEEDGTQVTFEGVYKGPLALDDGVDVVGDGE